MSLLVAGSVAIGLASCVSTEREANTSTADPRSTYTPPTSAERVRSSNKTVLNTVRAYHAFSDSKSEDNFVLELRGPRVLTSRAHLIVTNSKGDTLRHEVLPARALLSEKALDDPQSASVRDQEIAILQGMNNFFAVGHFSHPALGPDSQQPAEVDTKTWAALRRDTANVAFDYVGAGGAERRLTYVRKLGKTVLLSQ